MPTSRRSMSTMVSTTVGICLGDGLNRTCLFVQMKGSHECMDVEVTADRLRQRCGVAACDNDDDDDDDDDNGDDDEDLCQCTLRLFA